MVPICLVGFRPVSMSFASPHIGVKVYLAVLFALWIVSVQDPGLLTENVSEGVRDPAVLVDCVLLQLSSQVVFQICSHKSHLGLYL